MNWVLPALQRQTTHLTRLHVSELQWDKGSVTQSYNITAYPTYFLLDKMGLVLAKSNDLETIEETLKAIRDN
jgi:hypothetical protein